AAPQAPAAAVPAQRPVAAVAASTPPAVPAVAPAAPTPTGADGDWHAVAARLPGMARQLAQHCEFVDRQGSLVKLRLDPARKHLQQHQDKLRAALSELWGELRLEIAVAEPEGVTPAVRVETEKRERHERAVAAIEQDPFVRAAIDLFDASIDESTIKPV
ncbi:MAG TPA: DNA polymerase III subunit gamma/tau C-terminal domain-containing protein, partial [Rhodocyclaceae bacterium]